MNTNQLTRKSQATLQSAQSLASEYANQQLEPAHLLCALLQDADGLILQLLLKMNKDVAALSAATLAEVEKLPHVTGRGREPDKIYISAAADKVLVAAEKTAAEMKDEYISVEHLM
ncbi:MAG: Clp protease N-terminal domain-containing protein, partial [Pygmaiobacter sp.]